MSEVELYSILNIHLWIDFNIFMLYLTQSTVIKRCFTSAFYEYDRTTSFLIQNFLLACLSDKINYVPFNKKLKN